MGISLNDSIEVLKSINHVYAMFAGNLEMNDQQELVFEPKVDIGEDVENMLFKLQELQAENDRLVGENSRFSAELKTRIKQF